MPTHVAVSVHIESSPRHVFSFFSEAKRHQQWSGGLEYISATGRLEQGMTYQTRHIMLGREINSSVQVQSILPDRLLVVNNTSGPLQFHVTYALQLSDSGTQVTCTIYISSRHIAFNLAAPIFEQMVDAQLTRDLGNLKEAVEAEAKGGGLL